MSILDAVIILASVIKQISEDAGANSTTSTSLAARVEIIPRILKKIPETSEVDVDLLHRMYGFLKESHDVILEYKNKGMMSRMITAGSMRARFAAVEANIGRCIDDLSFNVGVTSAAVLESIRNDIRRDNEQRDGITTDTAPSNDQPVIEEDEGMDFAGFEEITSHIENLSSALKVYGSNEISEYDVVSGGKQPASSVVFYGDKMVVQNLRKPKEVEHKSHRDEEYSEEGVTGSMSMHTPALASSPNSIAGLIVFHIDNTSSMLREKRMILVKDVLKRVIPNFLRMGFRVIVNAWSSTPENRGAVKSREMVLDAALLQVLHGGASVPALQASGDGAEGAVNDDFAHTGSALSGDALIHQYLETKIFDILQPKGRTDLYGSCFQLIRQCSDLIRTADYPVHAFVLTDGEHNLLNSPIHFPTHEGEDYFGVFTAVMNKSKTLYKFEVTHKEPSVPVCEQFLRKELDKVNGRNASEGRDMGMRDNKKARLTVTFVGIGEAETKPLSDLTKAMGDDQCSFYGITEVSQCDEVFRNISAGSSEICVTCDLSSGAGPDGSSKLQVPLKCTFEDESSGWLVTHGAAARLEDHFAVQGLHTAVAVSVLQPSSIGSGSSHLSLAAATLQLPGDTGSVSPFEGQKITSAELHRRVNEFVSEIRRLRDTAYVVDASSFGTVFRQLMADKKALQSIKNSFLSKHTRRLRQYSLFSGLGIWLRELEELIESQIASYRMNVEGEILTKIAQGETGADATSGKSGSSSSRGASGSSVNGNYLQPTQLVLFRLQNNLSNAGRSSHRVVRHVAAISSIRDRTMHIACTLFTTTLSLHYLYAVSEDQEPPSDAKCSAPVGVRLTVQRAADTSLTATTATSSGKLFHVDWTIPPGSSATAEERVQQIYDFCLEVADSCAENAAQSTSESSQDDAYDRYSHLLAGLSNSMSKRTLPRNTANAVSLPIDATVVFPCILLAAKFDAFTIVRSTYVFFTCDVLCHEGAEGDLQAKVFCAQEIWELCHASNHIVGEPLPVGGACTNEGSATMSANMILPLAHTPLLFALYVERGRAYHNAVNVTADCMALTVVSLQWAKFFHDCLFLTLHAGRPVGPSRLRVFVQESLKAVASLAYCIDSHVMLPSTAGLNKMFAFEPERDASNIVTDSVVISREDCAGLTCSIGVASLVAGGHLPFAHSTHSWNILLRTLFSRLAEAISGQKIVRIAVTPVAVAAIVDIDMDSETDVVEHKDPGALENDYRLKLGELQGLLRKRLHVEWVKSTPDEKRVQVQQCPAEILACLRSIVESFLNRLDAYGLQSWKQTSGLVVQALLLKNYGIERLQREFVQLVSLSALEKQVIESGSAYLSNAFLLPVCELNAQGTMILREVTEHDIDHLIMYVDALVATKAGPKLEYKPILNPSFPVFSASDNRDVSFQQSTVAWDTSLPCANIAFIGNVNSGKSSISGILLEYLRIVPPDVVDRLGKIATKLGLSESLKHAWVMDTTPHERSGGFTVQSSWAGFQTPSRRYTIIDNPGHKDFCRNAAFGVFEADFVVLVMPANLLQEVNESDGSTTGESSKTTQKSLSLQAEEHLMTAFCFGVRELVVAVNKMDLVDYSQEAFEAVRAYTLKIMKKAGFKPESATFVPVSVTHGEGFLSISDRTASWYRGPCLLQACDELPLPRRVADKPLRMVIDGVYRAGRSSSGKPQSVSDAVVVTGRIERGVLAVNDEVNLAPAGPQRARVQSMMLHGTAIDQGRPGDIVGLSLLLSGKKAALKDSQRVTKGMIITLFNQPAAPVLDRFEVQLLVVKGTAFKVGYKPALTTHTVTVSVEIVRLVEIIGRNNTVTETNPVEVKAGQTVVCEMKSLRPFAAETIHDMPRLSRFLIKEDRAITAIGFIRRVIS